MATLVNETDAICHPNNNSGSIAATNPTNMQPENHTPNNTSNAGMVVISFYNFSLFRAMS